MKKYASSRARRGEEEGRAECQYYAGRIFFLPYMKVWRSGVCPDDLLGPGMRWSFALMIDDFHMDKTLVCQLNTCTKASIIFRIKLPESFSYHLISSSSRLNFFISILWLTSIQVTLDLSQEAGMCRFHIQWRNLPVALPILPPYPLFLLISKHLVKLSTLGLRGLNLNWKG